MKMSDYVDDKELFQEVSEKVWDTVSGKGILEKNRLCYSLTETIYYEFKVQRHALVNEIICYIMSEGLMDHYKPENSLGWYVVGIVWRCLKNKLRKLRVCAEMDRVMLDKLKREQEDDIYSLPDYGNPEKAFFSRERYQIIMKHVSEDEYDLLCGKLSLAEFAKIKKITYRGAWMRKKTLTDKLLIILHKAGYDKIS